MTLSLSKILFAVIQEILMIIPSAVVATVDINLDELLQ